jgi:outer membrane protein assembly factor BamB
MCRACLRLPGVGIPLALFAVLSGHARGLQGGAVPTADASGGAAPAVVVTLPTDRQAQTKLGAANEYLQARSWREAFQVLQALLDAPEDSFLELPGADGRANSHWRSVRTEVHRLLASLPAEALEIYQARYGPDADALLGRAKAGNDPRPLDEVARRYLYTPAGARALELLGTHHLDRGRFVQAAVCFERLFRVRRPEQVEPLTLFQAAVAFHRAGEPSNADRAWSALSARAPDGIRLGGRVVGLRELRGQVEQTARDTGGVGEWAVFRGNPSRSAEGGGGPPLPESCWQAVAAEDPEAKALLDRLLQDPPRAMRPVLPGSHPIAVRVEEGRGLLVYRGFGGVRAVHLATGREAWQSPSPLSLGAALTDPARKVTYLDWLQKAASPRTHFFENSTLGSLSADRRRVYAVEDMAVLPHAGYFADPEPRARPSLGPFRDTFHSNTLRALDLETGRVAWEVGGRGGAPALRGNHFLGPPLPLGGVLYAVNEKNQEIRLVCLDSSTGDLLWAQTLATANDQLLTRPLRRVSAAPLAYSDGTLVCPTNAGAVLGVDLLSRSLVWAFVYAQPAAGDRGSSPTRNPFSEPAAWHSSGPVIHGGRVVLTAADGGHVCCLNLRDGTLAWRTPRAAGDLYLAGVFGGKVLLVGTDAVRALDLADGKPLWRLATGTPAGVGAASGRVYYLPLKKGAICAIDLERGAVLARADVRPGDRLGNLFFHDGYLVSQSADAVTVYPPLSPRLAQLDRRLSAAPADAGALAERGRLRLGAGDLSGAADDLRAALARRSSHPTPAQVRSDLFEALTRLMRQDYARAEPYLAECEELCRPAVPDGATPEERVRANAEARHRRLTFLRLHAQGLERARPMDALRVYRELLDKAGEGELWPAEDDDALRVRSDVWIQERVGALYEQAGAVERQAIEEAAARQWRLVQNAADETAVRRFLTLYGLAGALAHEARLRLAELLLAEPERGRLLEAESHLLRLTDTEVRARALEMLARLLTVSGLPEDALAYYRLLARDYPRTVVRDGKTGAGLLADLEADRRFLPYLRPARPAWAAGRMRVYEVPPTLRPPQPLVAYEFHSASSEELAPSLRRRRLVVNLASSRLSLQDRATGAECWGVPVPPGRGRFLLEAAAYGDGQDDPPPCRVAGHLAVLAVGQRLLALDLLRNRVLWEKDLLEGFSVPQDRLGPAGGGNLGIYWDGGPQAVGPVGTLAPSSLCLLGRGGVTGVDPLSGDVLWTRSDVSSAHGLLGDGNHLYLVGDRDDPTAGAARAFRQRDGAAVPVQDFSHRITDIAASSGGASWLRAGTPRGR